MFDCIHSLFWHLIEAANILFQNTSCFMVAETIFGLDSTQLPSSYLKIHLSKHSYHHLPRLGHFVPWFLWKVGSVIFFAFIAKLRSTIVISFIDQIFQLLYFQYWYWSCQPSHLRLGTFVVMALPHPGPPNLPFHFEQIIDRMFTHQSLLKVQITTSTTNRHLLL